MTVGELIDKLMNFYKGEDVYLVDVYNNTKLFEVTDVDNVESNDFFGECKGVGIISE